VDVGDRIQVTFLDTDPHKGLSTSTGDHESPAGAEDDVAGPERGSFARLTVASSESKSASLLSRHSEGD
jgi:hypothetical protein